MKIQLDTLPENGKNFQFTRESAELNEALKDLISADYAIDVFILPDQSFYRLKGKLSVKCLDICSQCGVALTLPVTCEFDDLIMPKLTEPRGGRYSKGLKIDSNSDHKTEVVYFEGSSFDLGEYLHEIIALEQQDYPDCGIGDGCPNLIEAKLRIEKLEEDSEKFEKKSDNSNFAVLKDIKFH